MRLVGASATAATSAMARTREGYAAAMPLAGTRILITGGAGFIGTTLARRLVDANEIVALDNLHRDAVSGSDMLEHAS